MGQGKSKGHAFEVQPLRVQQLDSTCYAVPALHLERGLVKGTWIQFEPVKFYEHLPPGRYSSVDLMRAICVAVEDLEKIAKDRCDFLLEKQFIATGSYGTVLTVEGAGPVVAKVFSDSATEKFRLQCAELGIKAQCAGIGPRIFGYGWSKRLLGASHKHLVVFMERLTQVDVHGADERPKGPVVARQNARKIGALVAACAGSIGFHNDLKVDNIMFRDRDPCLIDFDLADPWIIKIAVTTSYIKYSFEEFFSEVVPAPHREELAQALRRYYDLFCLSLSIAGDHPWYPEVLVQIVELFKALRKPVFEPLLAGKRWLPGTSRTEIPIEVMVRQGGITAITVNLFDLQGNAFAHGITHWQAYPSLLKSNGVHWPGQESTIMSAATASVADGGSNVMASGL
mmetsp:Transcript_7585/g.16301  ORF Transcript_7585/g.16301 Transcript_7585/m.16301 type:complete len:398 (-) Transcript_7585:6-1199(-)